MTTHRQTYLMMLTPRTRTSIAKPTLEFEDERPAVLLGVSVLARYRVGDGWHMVFSAPSHRVARSMVTYASSRGLVPSLYALRNHEIVEIATASDRRDPVTETGMGSFPASDPPGFYRGRPSVEIDR